MIVARRTDVDSHCALVRPVAIISASPSIRQTGRLRRGVHRSIQALENDIRAWINQWNSDPKPFVWTKTPDEILERLATHLQRIPAAGYELGQRMASRNSSTTTTT